jgi:hypothetical protein
MYDNNNNCIECDQYVYDQHDESCSYYVDETLLEFLTRIQKENPEVKGYNK